MGPHARERVRGPILERSLYDRDAFSIDRMRTMVLTTASLLADASNFVRGFQGADDGVGVVKAAACCKHFYVRPTQSSSRHHLAADSCALAAQAYSLEGADGFTRHNFNAEVSKRDLAETFLPAFATCVAAAPEQIMCS